MTRVTGSALYPVWSPDGAHVAFSSPNGRPPMIATIGRPWDERLIETLPALGLPGGWLQAFSWSPDGRHLAGHRASGKGNSGISVYSFDSRKYQHLTDFGILPRWLTDSRRVVFFSTSRKRDSAIYLLDTRSGKVRELLSVAPNALYGIAPSRDDRRIYFAMGGVEADIWLATLH